MNRERLGGRPPIWLACKDHPRGVMHCQGWTISRCLTVESEPYPLSSWGAIWVPELRQDKRRHVIREKGKMQQVSALSLVLSKSELGKCFYHFNSHIKTMADEMSWQKSHMGPGQKIDVTKSEELRSQLDICRHPACIHGRGWPSNGDQNGSNPNSKRKHLSLCTYIHLYFPLTLLSIMCPRWQILLYNTGSINHSQCFSQHCIDAGCLSHMA